MVRTGDLGGSEHSGLSGLYRIRLDMELSVNLVFLEFLGSEPSGLPRQELFETCRSA